MGVCDFIIFEILTLTVEIIYVVELGNITILSFIMISKCHDNRYRREIFSIVISESTILS